MIGCPVGCLFCATGKLGFIANLSADEIVEQVLYFQRILKKENAHVTNVVFMGMGEPLLNLDEVLKAVAILTDPEKMALSDRRISISTSGYILQLEKLLQSGYKGKLAISLHAPEQSLRATLMPVAALNPLPELMLALDKFTKETNKRIFYEYLLINGVNDSDTEALQLAYLLKGKLAHVNLIPFNQVPGSDWKRSPKDSVALFLDILTAHGISATVRASMGTDIAGACGQLAGKHQ
jgi:23S rRNA (adenine2503-C2)-methyltransferase